MRTAASRAAIVASVAGLVATACSGAATTTGAESPGASVAAAAAPATTAAPAVTPIGAPVPSPGCGRSTQAATDLEKRTIPVGGAERWYLLTTPAKHDGKTPLPLVVDFHGLLEGAQIHAAMSKFGDLGKSEGFVVATPNGSGEPVRWDVSPGSSNQDLAFIDALLVRLGTELCIDTSRVYATGLSYGAIMTSFLTCQRSDKFAAVAPVAGLMVPAPCDQTRKVPILTIHGTADPILLFNGGAGSRLGSLVGRGDSTTPDTTPPPDLNGPGYPANAATWAERNGCQPAPTDTKVTENVIRRVYDCPKDAPVEFLIVLGGGHAWPGSEFSKSIEKVVGPTTFEIDATVEAWKFFQRYQLPQP
ncbi:MAG: prolyl oligopeptidase family serine peptidase [Actinobacteria bacterium]|nr:prolyl oligopeptidase family serine peptidase [Actinomycetota bacterium]